MWLQMLNGEDIAELQLDLASIVSQTAPDAQYAHYHAKGLELALQHMEQLQSGYLELLVSACTEIYALPVKHMFHRCVSHAECEPAQ